MSTAPQKRLSPREYLTIERQATIKSEYYNGEMFGMGGASREHNLIVGNTLRRTLEQLDDRPCEAYASDMRVKVTTTGLYTYPDVSIVCGEPIFEDAELDTLLNPDVLIEVLSKSTEGYDRGKKFEHYRKIDSLKEYVLIAQNACHVEHFVRQPDDRWVLWETDDSQDTLKLDSVQCKLKLIDVYSKVQLKPE